VLDRFPHLARGVLPADYMSSVEVHLCSCTLQLMLKVMVGLIMTANPSLRRFVWPECTCMAVHALAAAGDWTGW
jgi:hypothetical protein